MRGMIVIWSGAVVDIPEGWHLCDGNDGTPDLRGRFVVGAGLNYPVGASGGQTGHTHPFTGDGHQHRLIFGTEIPYGVGYGRQATPNSATGTTNNALHIPPFYALAYIMKT